MSILRVRPEQKGNLGAALRQHRASYIPGSFWKGDKVEATHNDWTITLDVYIVSAGKTVLQFTRLRAPYINPDKFRFTIYRKGVFSGLGKLLGMQDIEVGHPAFDEAFIIKGTDDAKVRALFNNARLRELINLQPDIRLSVKDDEGLFSKRFPEKVDELEFCVHGIIKDPERLKLLFDLFAVTLDELCRIGSAYEEAPGVTL